MDKKLYIAVNVLGAALIVLTFFSEALAGTGFFIVLAVGICYGVFWVPPLLIAVNIAAYRVISRSDNSAGVLLTLLFGGIGALIGLGHNPDPEYPYKTSVKIISLAELWLAAWLVLACILFGCDYYSFT